MRRRCSLGAKPAPTQHAKAMGKESAELRSQLESTGRLGALGADIIRRKALDLIVQQADIKDEAPQAQ